MDAGRDAADDALVEAGARREIGRRAVRGAGSLLVRQALAKTVTVLGGIALARILAPEDFGVYAIVLFGVALLTLVGDVGLAASLVQRPEEPSPSDYRAVFTGQVVVYFILSGAVIAAAPLVTGAFGIRQESADLVRLMAVSLVIASFRSVPTARLERDLRFGPLALAETLEVMVFQGLAVATALLGLGPFSLGVAFVVSQLVATILVNSVVRWPIGLEWDWARIRGHLRFGLRYQGFVVVDAIKNGVAPIVVGLVAGATAVGYISWATSVANYPIILVTILGRLYFPTFARLHDDPDGVRLAFRRACEIDCLAVYGLSAVILVFGKDIAVIVFDPKWLPATALFPYFVPISLLLALVVPSIALLNATNRPQIVFRFGLAWLVVLWLLGIPLVAARGFVGFGAANLAANLLDFALFAIVWRAVGVNVILVAIPYLVAATIAGVAMAVASTMLPPVLDLIGLLARITAGMALYVIAILLLRPRQTSDLVRIVRDGLAPAG